MPNAPSTLCDITTRLAAIQRPGSSNSAPHAQRTAPDTLDIPSRSVGYVLATENPALVYDWERGLVNEVLLMSGATYPTQVPMLDAHNRCSVDSQLGSLRDMQLVGPELHAIAYFSETAESSFTKVREGHLTDISVGYMVKQSVWIPEGTTTNIEGRTFSGPLKIVTAWEVREGSLTPIGADEYAKVRSAAHNILPVEAAMPNIIEPTQDKGRSAISNTAPENPPVNPEQQRSDSPPAPAAISAPTQAPSPITNEATRTSCADIIALGMRHNCPELAETAIRSGQSLDAFRAALLNHLSTQTERNAPTHRVEVGETSVQKFHRAACDALLLRTSFSHRIEKPAPGAQELRGYTLKELCRESLRSAGLSPHGDMDMVGRAFTSSSDFPAILANAAHKSVLVGAEEAGETFALWTGKSTATDFRTHTGVSLDAFSSLDLVPEGSEYKHGQFSERGVDYSVATYGKKFAITRQAIINDDLNSFTAIPKGMGRAAMRTVGNIVYRFLMENPQQTDGNALFSAAHKNLATTGKALDVASFGAGVTAMGTHKNVEGDTLNIRPAYLIIPIALQALAFQLLTAQVVGTQAEPNKPNPWVGYVVPIPEGRLDGTNPLPWFLAAQKDFAINVAWLGGNEMPRVEQRQGWSVDGTEYKISIDAGAYVTDSRGLYKNPGVAPA